MINICQLPNSDSSMRKVCPGWYCCPRSGQSDESIGKESHAPWKFQRFYRDFWEFHWLAKRYTVGNFVTVNFAEY